VQFALTGEVIAKNGLGSGRVVIPSVGISLRASGAQPSKRASRGLAVRKSPQKVSLREDAWLLFAEFPSITLCWMILGYFGQLSERVSAQTRYEAVET
jgi:hypothetical protein